MSESAKSFDASKYKIIASMTDNDVRVYVVEFDMQFQVICVDAYNKIYNDAARFDAAHEALISAALIIAHEYYLTQQLEFNVNKAANVIIDNLPCDNELLTAI